MTTKKQKQTKELNSNSSKIVERINIDNTPFTAIKSNEDWYLTMGNYMITKQTFLSVDAIKEYLKDPIYIWRTIATFSSIVAENTTKEILKIKQ